MSTPRGLLYATTLYGGLFLATVAETGVLEIPSPQELPLPFCVGCSEREFEGQRRPIAEPHSLLLIYSQFPRASPGSRCSAYFPPSPNSHLGLNLGFPPSLSVGLLFPLAALILSPGVWSPLDQEEPASTITCSCCWVLASPLSPSKEGGASLVCREQMPEGGRAAGGSC